MRAERRLRQERSYLHQQSERECCRQCLHNLSRKITRQRIWCQIKLTKRLGDSPIGCSGGRSGTAEEEVETRSTRTVADTDRTSELHEISGGDVVLSDEGLLRVDDVVNAVVGVEVGLNVVEDDDGAVGTSSSVVNAGQRWPFPRRCL